MLRLFIATFVAGALLAMVGAAVWPMPQHTRYRSITEVEADGGRREAFLIHWPADRITLPSDPRPADGAAESAAAGIRVLEDASGRRSSVELFRVRDMEGRIVGLGARLAGTGGAVAGNGRSVSGWVLVIPSRGALFLAHEDDRDLTVREVRSAAGNLLMAPENRVLVAGGPQVVAPAGRIRAGSGEFAGLGGRYSEVWETGDAPSGGAASGRIVLTTVTVREP